MKILAIIGSPRKGNTLNVTKEFEKELHKLGKFDFEYLFLDELDMKICIGCHNCLFKGEDKCPYYKEQKMIIDKMLKADGIILASPVYVMNVTALMKNFIDRICYICHRPALFRQDIMTIVTTGALGQKTVTRYLRSIAEVWGARSITSFAQATPPDGYKIDKKKLIKKARQFYHNLNKKAFSPTLNQLIQFRFQRAIFTSNPGKAISPADYEYFKTLKGKNFNVPSKINPIKNAASFIFFKIFSGFLR